MAETHFVVLLYHKLAAITFKCVWFLKYYPGNTLLSIYCGMFYHGTVKDSYPNEPPSIILVHQLTAVL